MTAEVWLLTGFLGSGKTTLLQRWIDASAPGELAVVVNEFAGAGLDQALVDLHGQAAADPILLASGCICCTIRDGLTESLYALAARRIAGTVPPFRRVLIETTGLADPNPVIHALAGDPRLAGRFHLAGVVTVVDATHGLEQLAIHPEAAAQVAAADHLVLAKADLADPGTLDRLEAELAAINPLAPRTLATHGVGAIEAIQSGPRYRPRALRPLTAKHGHGIAAHTIELERPVAWPRFSDWLQALVLARGRDLLRLKGVVRVTDDPVPRAVHAVNFAIYPATPLKQRAEEPTRLVIIGRRLDRERIARTLHAALAER